MGTSRRSRLAAGYLPKGVLLLHEDDHIIVVQKPAGLLTMGTRTDKTTTVYAVLTDYVRRGYAKSRKRIFIVHRLDKDTSGILVFAKSEEIKRRLQEGWKDVEKRYLAVVHGVPDRTSGMESCYLAENRAHVVYATRDQRNGKLSQTAWRVLESREDRSLLELRLLTGRKHQIRVHLSNMGHPILGDRIYGRRTDAGHALALHAVSLSFTHPASGEHVTFEVETPHALMQLLR
ncbi:MAG: RluA family pseudouridine synthase [Bacteroidetes bacterium]|nr:RluA family pseudouridine synthase [Bacteroidota bacterium]